MKSSHSSESNFLQISNLNVGHFIDIRSLANIVAY